MILNINEIKKINNINEIDLYNLIDVELNDSGWYEIEVGSRGEVEGVVYMGENDSIDVMDVDVDDEFMSIGNFGNVVELSVSDELSYVYLYYEKKC